MTMTKKRKPYSCYTKPLLPECIASDSFEQVYLHEPAPPMSVELRNRCLYATLIMLYTNLIKKNGYYLQLYFNYATIGDHPLFNNRPDVLKDWLTLLKENGVEFEDKVMHRRIGQLYSRETKYMFVLKFKSATDFNLARIIQPAEISGINPKEKRNYFSSKPTYNNNKPPLVTGAELFEMVSRAKSKPKPIKRKKKA